VHTTPTVAGTADVVAIATANKFFFTWFGAARHCPQVNEDYSGVDLEEVY